MTAAAPQKGKTMLAIEILKSMKEFRVDDELPFNTVDYLNIDTAIEELAALKAVADAAEEYTKVHGHNFGSGCACLLCEVEMALDALKGAE